MILYHPVPSNLGELRRPSYVDFFDEVLAESTDPGDHEKGRFEHEYATDPWYIHLYRTSHAYHGVHPFYMWYWAAHALDHLGDVVWVGADRRSVSRLGFRARRRLSLTRSRWSAAPSGTRPRSRICTTRRTSSATVR